jgi:hypothetical protein
MGLGSAHLAVTSIGLDGAGLGSQTFDQYLYEGWHIGGSDPSACHAPVVAPDAQYHHAIDRMPTDPECTIRPPRIAEDIPAVWKGENLRHLSIMPSPREDREGRAQRRALTINSARWNSFTDE